MCAASDGAHLPLCPHPYSPTPQFLAHVECRPYVHNSDDSLAAVFSFTLIFFLICIIIFKMQILVKAVELTLSDYFTLLYDMDTFVLTFGMMASLLGGLGIRCVAPPIISPLTYRPHI